MRTTPDFILSQPRLTFACHIRNVTPNAVSIPVPVGVLEGQPRLSDDAYERLLERNRLRVSLPMIGGDGGRNADTPPDTEPPCQLTTNQPTDDPTAASEDW